MQYDFDRVIDRRSANSYKWTKHPADVLPLWIADMDFPAPEPVIRALRTKVEHGALGYEIAPPVLLETVCARMERLYGWRVTPEQVMTLPSLVIGMHVAARAVCAPGEGVLMQIPVYPPFLDIPGNYGLARQVAELRPVRSGATIHYEIDFDAFEAALTDRTRLFLLCQPHNPTGQIYTREQLLRLSEICLRHNLVICSDEVHSELLLGDARHVPLAPLAPDIADRTITFVSASKTFNLAGLFCSFAIIPNPALRQQFVAMREATVPWPNSLGMAAALAAFTGGDDWLAQLRAYLTANRDAVVDFVAGRLPGIRTTVPNATHLAWLDCRDLINGGKMIGSPYAFFLERAKVALGDGAEFGPGGEGFVRLNFGCPRATLMEALRRMEAALAAG